MKFVASFVVALVTVLIVGCADHSSVNSPESMMAGVSKTSANTVENGRLKVDQQVIATGSGLEYAVEGTIDYRYETKETGSLFSYKGIANVRIVRINNPDEVFSFSQPIAQSGVVASGAQPDAITVNGMDNGRLELQFSVSNGFSLVDVTLSEGLIVGARDIR